MSDLREKAGSNKIMLMSIFQAAWAIILQEFNNVDDVAFSALIPDRKTANLNSIPVRIVQANNNFATVRLQQLFNYPKNSSSAK